MKLKLAFLSFALILTSASLASESNTLYPAVMNKSDIAGKIFLRDNLEVEQKEEGDRLDVVSLLSTDKKFVTGMYQAPAGRFVIDDAYGVDEYMHFLKGSVTLTSSDGTITHIQAGDSVTLAKEWTGVWETEGYTKIYVIYSSDATID